MQFVFLSAEFYEQYQGCSEIELKNIRPYVLALVKIDGITFAVPLRSRIKHKYVLWTNKEKGCGLDFSKAVVLSRPEHVDQSKVPHIRQDEFDMLRGKDHLVKQRLLQYIATYKKAKKRLDVPRNQQICQYSTLQYFEDYI